MVESDPPIAGPALTCAGGLGLLMAGLLAYSPHNPYFAPAVPGDQQLIWFLLVGPGLGPLIAALGIAAYLRPRYRVLLGSTVVPLALLGLFDGVLGALLIGTALAVIGGLLLVAFESHTDESAADDERGLVGWLRRNYAVVPAGFVVAGVALAAFAPTFASLSCPTLPSCVPGAACAAVAVACRGPTVWLVLLASGMLTAPLAFRLRASLHAMPLPA